MSVLDLLQRSMLDPTPFERGLGEFVGIMARSGTPRVLSVQMRPAAEWAALHTAIAWVYQLDRPTVRLVDHEDRVTVHVCGNVEQDTVDVWLSVYGLAADMLRELAPWTPTGHARASVHLLREVTVSLSDLAAWRAVCRG